VVPLIAGVFYAFAAPEYKFIGGEENQSPQRALYTITKDKIDIPFTKQLQKSDLETIKVELARLGMKIDYTSLDFTKDGSLKQISASIKYPDGTGGSFSSGELTSTDHPGFKMEPNGSFSFYRQQAITGKVISEDGKPLKGATIVISGTTIGTITDANGSFKLIMTDNSPIVISYVGFETQKVIPVFGKEMVITMKTNTIQINLNQTNANNQKENHPYSEIKIPFGREPNPLIVIDGVIDDNNKKYDKIHPETIASANILKGESATKKYGEKGKNGVVEIKLKNKNISDSEKTIVSSPSPPQFLFLQIKKDGMVEYTENGNTIRKSCTLDNELYQILPSLIGKDPKEKVHLMFDDGVDLARQKTVRDILQSSNISVKDANSGTKPVISIDGNIDENHDINSIPPETIESIAILKGESAISKYGEKGKNGVMEITTKKSEEVAVIVESLPEFPGGLESLKKFVASSMEYPAVALEKGIQGQVMVGFVVSKTGEITNVRIKTSVDPSLDKEAMRIVSSMPR
ncbi:MAG: TonB family protein, partial [Bacteroidia bacterium]